MRTRFAAVAALQAVFGLAAAVLSIVLPTRSEAGARVGRTALQASVRLLHGRTIHLWAVDPSGRPGERTARCPPMRNRIARYYAGVWITASMLCPSGSSTNAP
jgi:hypothetical protein